MANGAECSSQAESKFHWPADMSRALLQICNDQKDKGNWKGTSLTEMGRDNVRKEFLKQFGLDFPWGKFKNRLDHLKKQYGVYKRIVQDGTGLGFNDSGELDMSSDWWNELIKSQPEANKLRKNPLQDIPLLDRLYSRVTVSVSEGWQPLAGISQLPQRLSSPNLEIIESDDEMEAVGSIRKSVPRGKDKVDKVDDEIEPVGSIRKSVSRGKDKVVSSRKKGHSEKWERLTTVLEDQSKHIQTVIEDKGKHLQDGREAYENLNPYCCAAGIKELANITVIYHKSEFYWAAVDYITENENGRQAFMSLPNDEEKIRFLERKTGECI